MAGGLWQCLFYLVTETLAPVDIMRLYSYQGTVIRHGVGEVCDGEQIAEAHLVHAALGLAGKTIHVLAAKNRNRTG